MCASKMIMKNLTATVAVLFALLCAYGFVFADAGAEKAPAASEKIEQVEQENPDTYYDDGLGELLDGVFVDYCA